MRLSVVIPCLNEANTIAAVIRETHAGLAACAGGVRWSEIVVADNGSTDGSQDLARAAGARVVAAPVRGYGAALHWGIAHARGDFVLLIDADMSHDPMLASRFVAKMNEGPFDLILGSRLTGEVREGAMPWMNRFIGTPALNLVIRVCFGLRTSDCNSGMRLISRAFYRRIGMRAPGMEWASELLIKCELRGGRYAEVPIHVRPDERGRPPHLRRWVDGWRHLKSIVMLAPNVTLVLPSALAAVVSPAWMSVDPVATYASLWMAFAGLLVSAGVKLVLHVDGVRPSRIIGTMLTARTAEVGLLIAALLTAGGGFLLATATERAASAGGALLFAAGGATALGVHYWETAKTLLVSDMDAAWNEVSPAAQSH